MLLAHTKENAKLAENRLFVYGSLKDQKHEKDICQGQMRILETGYAVVRFDQPGIVVGEIHKVENFDELDKYREGPEYERVIVRTKFGIVAWSYQYREKSKFDSHEIVKDGEWKEDMLK